MKKCVKKAAGLILSVFLTLGLSDRVHAAEEEESLPAPAPTETVEPAPEAPEAEDAGQVDLLDEEIPDQDESSAEITIGDKDVSEQDGWSYDESSGQVGLVNFDHPETSIVSSGAGGLSIAASGYNRLLSIISDGDVNVTGTGLLLLDDVFLGENSGFYLHTPLDIYQDGTGSVAVFLKSGINQYTLVNGSVPGLLDEQYTITGVDLVVPDGSTLFLNSGGTVYNKETGEIVFRYTGDEGEALVEEYGITASPIEEECSHGIDETYGSLTIGANASLTVEIGGTILMESTQGIRSWSDIAAPAVLADGGPLVVDGTITGDGRIVVGEDTSLSGSGSASAMSVDVGSPEALADCDIQLSSPEIRIHGVGTIPALNIDKSIVFLHNNDGQVTINRLVNAGESQIINQNELVLESINNSGTITLFSDSEYPSAGNIFDLAGAVSGGTLQLTGGVYRLVDQFALQDGAELSCDHVIVYDYVGSSASVGAPLIISPDQTPAPSPVPSPTGEGEAYSVPLVIVESGYETAQARSTVIHSIAESAVYFIKNDDGDYVLDLKLASSYLGGENLLAKLLGSESVSNIVIELHSLDENGELSFQTISYESDSLNINTDLPIFTLGKVFLVRITAAPDFPILPGASITSTSTAFTGSGILGGSGAGSLTGGSGYMLFRQSTSSHQSSETSDPDPDEHGSPSYSSPAAADPTSSWQVVVQNAGEYDSVFVYDGEQAIPEPGCKITARMRFTLPKDWDPRAVFAVFRNADGTLTAFKTSYSALTGTVSFNTDLTGFFALVYFPFEGEPFSEGFYAALEELDIIRALPVRR
ncbi:MAG: hypothetical protein IKO22_03075 [Oscillospiraceae bacterium]|nr:hypothetical protein [Oscillospiraceae bacterium]